MKYCIDEAYLIKKFLYIRGWCFSDRSTDFKIDILIRAQEHKNIEYSLHNSKDVVAAFGIKAEKSRFDFRYIFETEEIGHDINIKFYNALGEIEMCNLRNYLSNINFFSRTTQILSGVDTSGIGLEIGPLDNPVVPKKAGFNVHTMDHMNKEGLTEKYRDDPNVNTKNIEEVDYVWDGRRYSEITGKINYYDYILASHLIEHTTDLIGFLQQCEEILNEKGVLSLAIPDKRYCFDCFRPVSSLASIIDNHLIENKAHSPGTVAEQLLYAAMNEGKTAWTKKIKDKFDLCHSVEGAQKCMNDVIENNTFYDVHQWVFTPNSFRLILRDLQDLGFTNLKEVAFHDTVGYEFFITLAKGDRESPNVSRLQLLSLQ